ncbi:hypothetical protein ILYODFUR_001013 [Ilyodon furcidens]|uniref:Uncharacterized protein n=1 Tax=Ilyodon furcidens TaxID=33524 RepID=A0ABV0UPT7_9TELE
MFFMFFSNRCVWEEPFICEAFHKSVTSEPTSSTQSHGNCSIRGSLYFRTLKKKNTGALSLPTPTYQPAAECLTHSARCLSRTATSDEPFSVFFLVYSIVGPTAKVRVRSSF